MWFRSLHLQKKVGGTQKVTQGVQARCSGDPSNEGSRARQILGAEWTTNLAKMARVGFNERPCLKKLGGEWYRKTPDADLWHSYRCAHTQVSTPTHRHVYTRKTGKHSRRKRWWRRWGGEGGGKEKRGGRKKEGRVGRRREGRQGRGKGDHSYLYWLKISKTAQHEIQEFEKTLNRIKPNSLLPNICVQFLKSEDKRKILRAAKSNSAEPDRENGSNFPTKPQRKYQNIFKCWRKRKGNMEFSTQWRYLSRVKI